MIQEEEKGQIVIHSDVSEFFFTLLDKNIQSQKIDVSARVVFYITNLLKRYAFPEVPPIVDGCAVEELPLALLMAKAMASSIVTRVKLLKILGDRSLYISGFFSNSLNRELIDIDYYIKMGGNAFGNLSDLVTSSAGGRELREIYGELSIKFQLLVDLLAMVSEECSFSVSDDILRIYEKWLKTGSQRLARKLEQHGIIPDETIGTAYIQ